MREGSGGEGGESIRPYDTWSVVCESRELTRCAVGHVQRNMRGMQKVPTESEVSKALLTCVDMRDVLSVWLCFSDRWFEGVGNGAAWRWVQCTEHCCGANGELGDREGLCADAVDCGQWQWRVAGTVAGTVREPRGNRAVTVRVTCG